MSPALLLLGGGALVLAGLALALAVLGAVTPERRGAASSLAAIRALGADPGPSAPGEEPFVRRVVAPYAGRLASLGRRLSRQGVEERLQRRLDVAGDPEGWDVERLLGAKVLALAVLGSLTALYGWAAGHAPLRVVLAVGVLAAAGFVLPDLLLHNAGQKREARIRRALPDALDLLTVSVEAGLGFDAAAQKVARHTTGPLAEEFARLLQEMQLGVGRAAAMRALGERSTIKELRSFCQAMVQADQLGVPLGRVLRIQSREMRLRRRQAAEERAQKVPVKIMIPLVLCILPCLFIVVLGPAALRITEVFG